MTEYLYIFFGGGGITFLIVSNVFAALNRNLISLLICTFAINFIWSNNVVLLADADTPGRCIYALGACTGAGISYLITRDKP